MMKPVKQTNAKQNTAAAKKEKSQGATKKVPKEKSTNKIQNYFQSGSITSITSNGGTIGAFNNTKPVYVDALKKKLDEALKKKSEGRNVVEEGISNEKEDELVSVEVEDTTNVPKVFDTSFELECQESNVVPECAGCLDKDKKYKDLLKLYLRQTHRYCELEQKYTDLLATKTRSNNSDQSDEVPAESDIFTQNEEKYLQAMPLDKSSDSTFIRKCLEFAYKSDPSVLRSKTLKGRSECVTFKDDGEVEHQQAEKDPLTPAKVERIRQLFIARLSKCQINSVEYGQRIKDSAVNRLFATSIINISKKSK